MSILLIGVGGFAGAITRYLVDGAVADEGPNGPSIQDPCPGRYHTEY